MMEGFDAYGIVLRDLYAARDRLDSAITAVEKARHIGDAKARPADCAQPIKCGWHKVRTEPDINMWSCSVPGCNHMARALNTTVRA